MQDQQSLTRPWLSCSGWVRERVSCVSYYTSGQYLRTAQQCTKVNILWLAVWYRNATLNRNPDNQYWGLEPTGLAKPAKTCRLTGMGRAFAPQHAAGQDFGMFWNQSKPCFWSKSGPLATYLDPLLTHIAGTLMGGQNALRWSNAPLTLTHQILH
jgi:hypothetical protein